MAEHPNVASARASLEGLMKGDLEALAAGIAEDAVWHVPGTNQWAGDFSGRQAVLDRFARMAEQGYSLRIEEIHDIVGNDDHVVALVQATAIGPTSSTTNNSVWLMHVSDGMATEFWGYNSDQAAVDSVLG